MEKSIDIEGTIINELPQELEDFAMGCLLSSAEFLDKKVEFSELNVSAKILEEIKILELMIKAKYSVDNEERILDGTIEKIGNEFSQFLWITIKKEHPSIKDISRIVTVDYLMNIEEGKYLRNSNRSVLHNNGEDQKTLIEPIELSIDKIIEIGQNYRKENKNVL